MPLPILSPLYSIFYKWDRTQDGNDISPYFVAFPRDGPSDFSRVHTINNLSVERTNTESRVFLPDSEYAHFIEVGGPMPAMPH